MSVLDTSIVNVAIPTIQTEFGGTTDDVQWVVTGYTLTLGVVVPITAWLGIVSGSSGRTTWHRWRLPPGRPCAGWLEL